MLPAWQFYCWPNNKSSGSSIQALESIHLFETIFSMVPIIVLGLLMMMMIQQAHGLYLSNHISINLSSFLPFFLSIEERVNNNGCI